MTVLGQPSLLAKAAIQISSFGSPFTIFIVALLIVGRFLVEERLRDQQGSRE